MKHRILLVGILSLLASLQSVADTKVDQLQVEEVQKTNQQSALSYLNNMEKAYKQLNYELLYLNTRENQIEPKQLIHGVLDGKRISYFRHLNGTMRESLQFDGKISYYEQGGQAYSLATSRDQSVFASIANFDFESGHKSYEYIILGKGRIAGKKAIAIRMISKDEYRYSYIIWLDLESYLPLRLDTISNSNLILEQTMVVSLNISEDINPWIAQLSAQKTPEVLHLPTSEIKEIAQWDIAWLPEGFKVIKDDQHKLMMHDTDPVSYIMLNDGIVSISVYISTKNAGIDERENVIQRGSTLLYTLQQGIIEVNIIGEIPLITAEKIATSIKVH